MADMTQNERSRAEHIIMTCNNIILRHQILIWGGTWHWGSVGVRYLVELNLRHFQSRRKIITDH